MFSHTFKIESQNLRALPKHVNSIKIRNETCLIVFTTIRIAAGGVMFLKQIRTSLEEEGNDVKDVGGGGVLSSHSLLLPALDIKDGLITGGVR